jgi:hypothetical protein
MGYRCYRITGVLWLAAGLLAAAGCANNAGPSPPATGRPADHGGTGHSHERGTMMLADAGTKYHALLTSHLDPEGNELDIFFETAVDQNPTPVALPMESFKAVATAGAGEPKELDFRCAPADERPPGEKSGTCSHFVAKAPWMKPSDKLLVKATLRIDGEDVEVRWKDFDVKKYAHVDKLSGDK